jgi:hypothetical protein
VKSASRLRDWSYRRCQRSRPSMRHLQLAPAGSGGSGVLRKI